MKNLRVAILLVSTACAFCLISMARSDIEPNAINSASMAQAKQVCSNDYDALTAKAAARYGISADFLCRVINADGPPGHIRPAAARLLGIKNTSDPNEIIPAIAKLLSDYLQRFGSERLAAAAYDAGPAAVQKYRGIPPYNETKRFVARVMRGRCEGFAGTWKTSFGEMSFTITGSSAAASYAFDGGTVRGTLSPDGKVLSGTYIEKEAKGTFRFTLADDGQSFSGTWQRTSGRREPPSGTWEGKCIQP
ncbi:MAG: transglycosylase SLT domain-containing protein [Acidobacteriota bacterium]